MEVFAKLLALLKAGLPLPNFADAAATEAWLIGLAPSESALIALLVGQIKLTGSADIALPDGSVATIYERSDGTFGMAEERETALCSAAAGALEAEVGKINWAALFAKIMPIILQILPLFLNVVPTPAPTPTPPPVV
jgi:hypothetical protein